MESFSGSSKTPLKATKFRNVSLSCVEDFSPGWVTQFMEVYYRNKYGAGIAGIKDYSVEQLGDGVEFARSDSLESTGEESNEESNGTGSVHSTLSQSFRLVVEMDQVLEGGGERSPPALMAAKMHNLFVKVPLAKKAKFERIVKRNRTLSHEVQVYSGFVKDLQQFVKSRVGDNVSLNIPELYFGSSDAPEGDVLVIEDLSKQGFASRDWFKHKLSHEEVLSAVYELAKFHACGLAYRMSLNEEIEEKYPYLDDDLYTSNMAKELLAKYLDSYFHFLSVLPGIKEHVLKLRKISSDVFSLLVKLRRPSDPLGRRFNTICHGDMWMGNLMYNGKKCVLVDFHSCQYLSPATDLAHLLLTSTDRAYRKEHWDEVVQYYYDTFNRTLAEFGLILRHLGTTYDDFLYEVKRALRGQFLCVAFIIPIVIYCGPGEWRIERRRGSSVDRKNTVRHLIQMMAISEESSPSSSSSSSHVIDSSHIPAEFAELYNDEPLRNTLVDLIKTAADLDILDFHEFCKHIDTPRPMWTKTQATTGKHIPVY